MKKIFINRYAPLLAFLILAAIMVVLFNKDTTRINNSYNNIAEVQQTQAHVQQTLVQKQLQQCHQANIRTAWENDSHYADYKFYKLTYTLIVASLAKTPPANPQQADATRQYLGQLRANINSKTWIALNPCTKATAGKGIAYRQPVPFHKKLAPKAALTVGRGE